MPAPSIIVTLEDAKGTEWPVRLWGLIEDWSSTSGADQLRYATEESDRLAEVEPRWKPEAPLKLKHIEPLNQDI